MKKVRTCLALIILHELDKQNKMSELRTKGYLILSPGHKQINKVYLVNIKHKNYLTLLTKFWFIFLNHLVQFHFS